MVYRSRFRVWVQGLGSGVQDTGFSVYGLGFGGLGFKI